jgi:hypothetical protein
MADDGIDANKIIDVCFGYWKSKVLMTAVELDLFTQLHQTKLTSNQLIDILKVKSVRGFQDLLDCLVSMEFLQRSGDDVSSPF